MLKDGSDTILLFFNIDWLCSDKESENLVNNLLGLWFLTDNFFYFVCRLIFIFPKSLDNFDLEGSQIHLDFLQDLF